VSNGPRTQTGGSENTQVRAPGYLDNSLQGATNAANMAFGGNEDPNTVAGRNLVGQTLRGDFLSPDSNPFIQQTFDRGADAIQSRLDSQFAGAGRNIGASKAPATAELSDFASSLFGGNFENERNRQVQSLGFSEDFNPIDMFIKRLQGIAPSAGQDINNQFSSEVEKKASPADRAASIIGSFFGLSG